MAGNRSHDATDASQEESELRVRRKGKCSVSWRSLRDAWPEVEMTYVDDGEDE